MSGKRTKRARKDIRTKDWTYLYDHPDGWIWAMSAILNVPERWLRKQRARRERRKGYRD